MIDKKQYERKEKMKNKLKEPTHKQIEKAKDILKRAGFIPYYWHIDDIAQRDAEINEEEESDLTDKELRQIAEDIADNADANYGICWETFDSEIEEVKRNRKTKTK